MTTLRSAADALVQVRLGACTHPQFRRAGCLLALLLLLASAGVAQEAQRLPVREVFRLGGDAVEEETSFTTLTDIGIGPRGETIVLGQQQSRAAMFDASGRYLRAFGRAGSGPGEFRFASALHVDSLITIFDVMQKRYSTFDFNGRHRATIPLPDVNGGMISQARASGDGIVGATVTRFTRMVPPEQEGIRAVVFLRSARVDTLITYRGGFTQWVADGGRTWGGVSAPTGDLGAWIAFADTIVTANGMTGQVRWFTTRGGLRPVREMSLGLTARRVNDQDRDRFIAELREEQKDLPKSIQINGPSHWSVATRIVRADNGALWIRNGQTGAQGNTYTEITPAGQLRRWVLPDRFNLMAAQGQRLYGSQPTALDAPTLLVLERTD